MCTVSFVPIKEGFVLTSNRDESPVRPTLSPMHITTEEGKVRILAPIDIDKSGSWIATDERGKTACLLNGGFKRHIRKPPYDRSRGKIVLEAFDYKSFDDFLNNVNLKNIEPFTLILIENRNVRVLVWDELRKNITHPNPDMPHLWSSVTLYTEKQHREKLNFFINSLKARKITPERILEIHGLKGSNVFVINRKIVRTVSTTQIIGKKEYSSLDYYEKEYINNSKDYYHSDNSSHK